MVPTLTILALSSVSESAGERGMFMFEIATLSCRTHESRIQVGDSCAKLSCRWGDEVKS
jgi:hypothetical protein